MTPQKKLTAWTWRALLREVPVEAFLAAYGHLSLRLGLVPRREDPEMTLREAFNQLRLTPVQIKKYALQRQSFVEWLERRVERILVEIDHRFRNRRKNLDDDTYKLLVPVPPDPAGPSRPADAADASEDPYELAFPQARTILTVADRPFPVEESERARLTVAGEKGPDNAVAVVEEAMRQVLPEIRRIVGDHTTSFDHPGDILINFIGSITYLLDAVEKPYWPAINEDIDCVLRMPDDWPGSLPVQNQREVLELLQGAMRPLWGEHHRQRLSLTAILPRSYMGEPYPPDSGTWYFGSADALADMSRDAQAYATERRQQILSNYHTLFHDAESFLSENDPVWLLKAMKRLLLLAHLRGDTKEAEKIKGLLMQFVEAGGTNADRRFSVPLRDSLREARPLFNRSDIPMLVGGYEGTRPDLSAQRGALDPIFPPGAAPSGPFRSAGMVSGTTIAKSVVKLSGDFHVAERAYERLKAQYNTAINNRQALQAYDLAAKVELARIRMMVTKSDLREALKKVATKEQKGFLPLVDNLINRLGGPHFPDSPEALARDRDDAIRQDEDRWIAIHDQDGAGQIFNLATLTLEQFNDAVHREPLLKIHRAMVLEIWKALKVTHDAIAGMPGVNPKKFRALGRVVLRRTANRAGSKEHARRNGFTWGYAGTVLNTKSRHRARRRVTQASRSA